MTFCISSDTDAPVERIVASEIIGVAYDLLSKAPSINIKSHPKFFNSKHISCKYLFIDGPANSIRPSLNAFNIKISPNGVLNSVFFSNSNLTSLASKLCLAVAIIVPILINIRGFGNCVITSYFSPSLPIDVKPSL